MIDGILISKIKKNLINKLPIRINKIITISKYDIVFEIYYNNTISNLIISLNPDNNYLCLSNKKFQTYDTASNFCMVLRKYLINSTITSIDQIDLDRYLVFNISGKNGILVDVNFKLYIELIGKYSNLILVDQNNKIIESYKKIMPYESQIRPIINGIEFKQIENQNKINPFITHNFKSELDLVKTYSGFSKLLEKEVKYRLQVQSFNSIMDEIKASENIYIYQNNYHVIELKHLNKKPIIKPIDEAFNYLFSSNLESQRIKDATKDISKFISKQIKHFQNKIIKLNQTLIDNQNSENDLKCGQILFTYSNLNQKGFHVITLNDFENNKIDIKLDEKLTIKENANKYFQKYQKKSKSIKYLSEQIEISNIELDYFKSLNEQISLSDYLDALDIKQDLINKGFLKTNVQNKYHKQKHITLYQIKYKDHLITFGKNNIQNNELTFKYSKPNYTWFHAKNFHGSHLVVNTDKPSEDVVRLCATICAYFSKARYSSSVPVDYCLVKNVKKVSKKPIGFVAISNQKTIYIDPISDESITIYTI